MEVYFLGIGGAGMSALASVLVSQGCRVSGSDEDVFPPVSTYLDRMDIPWRDGFDAARLPPRIDAAIIGRSAKLELAVNPELAELSRRGVPCNSFPQFLGDHTVGRDNILVAGSFGKSTLTALLAWLMRCAGRDPGWFVGAVPLDLPATGHWGADRQFLIEADEYIVGGDDRRPKFLLYEASSLIITSIVHDHLNVFPTMADYEAAFAALLERLPPGAPLFCARGFTALDRLATGRPVVWYGREAGEGYCAQNIRIGERSAFELVTPRGECIGLATDLIGLHNIENIVGAAAVLLEGGLIDVATLRRGVGAFRGLERRLDRKTTRSSVPIYEGFGSSFEKARSAIEAVLLHFPSRPMVVIFEPHAFSWRRREGLAWYDTVFAGADRVILLPPPEHGADDAQASAQEMAARIGAAGVAVAAASGAEQAMDQLGRTLTGEEVILLLSSGPLAGLAQTLPPWLEAHFPSAPDQEDEPC